MNRLLVLALLPLATFALDCRDHVTSPPAPVFSVRVELTLSAADGGPGQPVVAAATAVNDGTPTLYRPIHCGTPRGLELTVHDPSGEPVRLSWNDVELGCPDGCCAAFTTGDREDTGLSFDGLLYTDQGQKYAAPAGDYTVVAAFMGYDAPHGGRRLRFTRQAKFHWAGSGPSGP